MERCCRGPRSQAFVRRGGGLALALVFFTLGAIGTFTIGSAIAAGRVSYAKLIREPAIWAAVIAVGQTAAAAAIKVLVASRIRAAYRPAVTAAAGARVYQAGGVGRWHAVRGGADATAAIREVTVLTYRPGFIRVHDA